MKPKSEKAQALLAVVLTSMVTLTGYAKAVTVDGSAQRTQNPVIKIEEGFVDVQSVLIYYKQLGSGPPLMVLHGSPGAGQESWRCPGQKRRSGGRRS